MKKRVYQQPTSLLEQHLLSLKSSGIYFTNHDFVTIAKTLEITLPYKKRSLVLQKLLLKAKEVHKEKQLFDLLYKALSQRIQAYQTLAKAYHNLQPLCSKWIQKASATQLLLQREIALHVKDTHE